MEDPWQSICDLESKCEKLEPPKTWEEESDGYNRRGLMSFHTVFPVHSLQNPVMTLLAAVLPDSTPWLFET